MCQECKGGDGTKKFEKRWSRRALCDRKWLCKEAIAVIEVICKWLHFLKGRLFTTITDQEPVSFMFAQTNLGKIKNAKIVWWRLEVGQLHYDIRHQPGVYNIAPDA